MRLPQSKFGNLFLRKLASSKKKKHDFNTLGASNVKMQNEVNLQVKQKKTQSKKDIEKDIGPRKVIPT